MKYILNTGRYALGFTLETDGGFPRKFEFDRQRFYKDTGNLATTGITEVEDDDFKSLEKIAEFKKMFENGTFKEVEKPVSVDESRAKLAAQTAEIENLKKQLASAEKPDVKKLKEESKQKDTEIANLKAQLEALKKNKSGNAEDTAGF